MGKNNPNLIIPIISSDEGIIDRATRTIERFKKHYDFLVINNMEDALENIYYELPNIVIINYSDRKINAKKILSIMTADPWLHNGLVILTHDGSCNEDLVSKYSNINIICTIIRNRFVNYLYRILKLIYMNPNILMYHELRSKSVGILYGQFILDNDILNVQIYSSVISNFLFNLNLVTIEQKQNIYILFFELLMNAIEHGNCEITFQDKRNWLNEGKDIFDLTAQRNTIPRIKNRHVYIDYCITPVDSFFSIRDEGSGFDWKEYLNKNKMKVNLEQHGHGIAMAQHYSNKLQYNQAGNEVSFEITSNTEGAHAAPAIFSKQPDLKIAKGEVLFKKGERPDYFYFIISGTLQVLRNQQEVSILNNQDVFIGEVALILNINHDSSVTALEDSMVKKIHRSDFYTSLRKNPHYAVYFSRVIAQRFYQYHQNNDAPNKSS